MLLVVLHRIMMHLRSLEITQEARVMLFRALQISRMHHNSMEHAKAWTNCQIYLTYIYQAEPVALGGNSFCSVKRYKRILHPPSPTSE